jgi:hypothetical protein
VMEKGKWMSIREIKLSMKNHISLSSISIESRYEVTWRLNVENSLYDVKYSKSQPLKSHCQSKIKCENSPEVKKK